MPFQVFVFVCGNYLQIIISIKKEDKSFTIKINHFFLVDIENNYSSN